MGFIFRRQVGRGPVRLTVSKSGVSPSVRRGRISVSRRGVSVRLLKGLTWRSGR